ncbi:MAG: non-homologous end-joining DNA ligase [Acidimicrobiia bacterium]|nr:MAG: non-homologous end-joining DNA ligase [Acidimicrobiia bacterium]
MTITNPDRVLFPDDGFTKADVADYYDAVADRMLPHLSGRPLTVERFPKGIEAKGFMQKNRPGHAPSFVGAVEMDKRDGVTVYPVVDDREGLDFFANLSTITFHVPTVTVIDDWHPDWVIWDLDPPEGDDDVVTTAAATMRSFLAGFGIETLLMATGSKGFHLRAPIERTLDSAQTDRLARGTAVLAVEAHPDQFTTAFKKADRAGRVFVDWLRNMPRATSVVPYSLRPKQQAPVAAPLAWDELSLGPTGVTLRSIDDRLSNPDPWGDARRMDLSPIAGRIETALDDAGITLEPFDRFRS